MTCERPGQGPFEPVQVDVERGETEPVDWEGPGDPCGTDAPGNVLPVANFDFTPAAPETGQQVNFISTSVDSDGAIAPENTKWDLDDDGAFDDATGLTATQTFNSVGSFEVSIEVTDNDGAVDTETKTIDVSASANTPPAAGFTFTPSSPAVGQDVVFDSTSTDADGDIEQLAWDFDSDGQFDDGLGGQVVRAFTQAGAFPVSLRATDDDGGSDTATRLVIVGGQAASPVPRTSASQTAPCRGLPPTIVGTSGDDVLRGTGADDVIVGLGGDDRLLGLGRDDTACGGGGDDRLGGGAGNDTLLGNRGDDRLRGGNGRDLVRGGQGRDLVGGGAGRDRCGGGTLSRCP